MAWHPYEEAAEDLLSGLKRLPGDVWRDAPDGDKAVAARLAHRVARLKWDALWRGRKVPEEEVEEVMDDLAMLSALFREAVEARLKVFLAEALEAGGALLRGFAFGR